MLIRDAQARDADHLVRFVNLAADDLPLHIWRKSAPTGSDPMHWGRDRAARDSGNFSYRNAWLAEFDGQVAACLLGYPAAIAPEPIRPGTPPILAPLLELEALAPGAWYLNVLATYPQFRGRGCGAALLARAEAAARAAGRGTISLIAADTHRDALRLYRARGFAEIARRPVVRDDWEVDASEWILLLKPIEVHPAAAGSALAPEAR